MKAKRTMSARERIQWANQNDAHYAALSGRPAKYQQELPKERGPIVHSDPGELEAAVMKEVAQVLRVHPKVRFAERRNSGSAKMTVRGGKEAPVWFYKIIREPDSMDGLTVVDYGGFLYPLVPFAFECKRRNWVFNPLDKRERQQSSYLGMIRNGGGVAHFVTSGEQALAILNQA